MSEENKDLLNNDNEENNDEGTVEVDSTSENEYDIVFFGDTQPEATEGDCGGIPIPPVKKEKRRISIKAFVISLIAVIVATVMLTYSICSAIYQSMYAKAYVDANKNSYINGNVTGSSTDVDAIDVIAEIVKNNYYGELDAEALMNAAIDAYIAQTGDIYAAYYTQAELDAQQKADTGNTVGVGISIINSTVTYKGAEIKALKITNIVKDSPAQKAGVKIGDYVYAAIIDGKQETVNDLDYDPALNKLLGEEGTTASFVLLREENGELKEITFNIVREKIISSSVYYRVPSVTSNAEKKIGVIQIIKFDYTTPKQFCDAVDALKASGCNKFVIDVRNNPGGYQSSIGAVLSYFLDEGDIYIRTKDKSGNIESDTIKVVSDYQGDYAGCNVRKEDIGKYKGLDITVLCNEYTASAGELFVATFKDYKLGEVIGGTTFGKGKLQTTYDLQAYAFFNHGTLDVDGAVKITTHEYYSAKSGSYDGIGIKPDVEIPLSDAAKQCNIYDYGKLDPIDDQLLKAINILNS